ncbi:MAG: thiolase family protein [Candidatus Magasanikbacteria bacterium]|nr:thiolase family protein [Candidatus Magasanikbacteria bacterium]
MKHFERILAEDPVVIIDGGKRTPRADILHENRSPGLFSGFTTNQLGAMALKAVITPLANLLDKFGHVIAGTVGDSHRESWYGARHVGLLAGLPEDVPALTVQRLCGSGAEAIVQGTMKLLLGDLNGPFVAVVGMQSMQYPHVAHGLRGRHVKYGPLTSLPPGAALQDMMLLSLFDPVAGMAMANTAELLGRQNGITREECDRFALQSNERAKAARDTGYFDEETVPVSVPVNGGVSPMDVCRDTHIRDDASYDGLAGLRPTFEPGGMITAGNASGVVDGAAAMVLCQQFTATEHNLQPLARIVAWGYGACDPKIMGWGPVPATKQALGRAGLTGDQIDWVELNEAFAPQALACIKGFTEMGIDPEKVNPYGGAIALGHPLGATGAILTLTAAYGLRRTGKRYALITMCIGGGQGISLIIENPLAA